MTPAAQARSARVLLALEGRAASAVSMQTAVRLAMAMQTEVAGVFVEDLDLMRLAALPFTQETGLVSGAPRPLALTDVERTLRRRAEQARRSLADLAGASRVRWSFEIIRSKVVMEVLAALGRDDVVVAGEGRIARPQAAGADERDGGVVAVLLDKGEAGDRVLEAALGLAQGRPQRICLLVPPAQATHADAMRERAAGSPHVGGRAPRVVRLRAPGAAELVRETRSHEAAALVLSLGSLQDGDAALRVLLAQMNCPLVLTQ